MRIAMVRSTLHKGSGQTVHIRELTKRLHDRGLELEVFTREPLSEISPTSTTKVEFRGSNFRFIRHFGFMAKCGTLINGYDLVHTHYHPEIFTGNFVRVLRKIPHVFTFHGYAPIRGWRNPIQELKMLDHTIGTIVGLHSGVDRVIAISQYVRKQITDFYRLEKSRVTLIYNGVDAEKFHPGADDSFRIKHGMTDEPIVLYLGRMDPYKGVHILLKAAPLVLETVPDAKLVIAGGTRFDQINAGRFFSRKMRNALIFTGQVPETETPALYTACDVFCYPSMWEGFGLTPAEAQASAKPVVAFNHCAIPEVVKNEETGILVRPGDHHELAKGVIQLLKDPDLRHRMGMKGRSRVEKLFSWDIAAEKTLELYKELAGSRGRSQ